MVVKRRIIEIGFGNFNSFLKSHRQKSNFSIQTKIRALDFTISLSRAPIMRP